MTSLIHKIEQLIKREKTTPERKKDDSKKSSSEILSELFSAFNADPPKIDEISIKKSKKSKKKHKKEKKKRYRSDSSSSDSDKSSYSHKKKKRKKSKLKKRRESHTPSRSRSHTPPKIKLDPESLKLSYKTEHVKSEDVKIKEEIKSEPKSEAKTTVRIKNEEPNDIKKEKSNDIKLSLDLIDTSLIPMPDSPTKENKSDSNDLRLKLDNKREAENDKTKGKIQIKNLKFSTVFEETVKKAEEEARKRAEKYEEGEYTDSSSSSVREVIPNSEFPKTSDPGGLKRQATDDVKM